MQLKSLKTEIEHLQHLLEKARLKLQSDFEEWWIRNSTNNKSSLTLPHIVNNGGSRGIGGNSVLMNSISTSSTTDSLLSAIDKQKQITGSTDKRAYKQHLLMQDNDTRVQLEQHSNSITSPRLTGDSRTDEDIIAFYKARQKMVASKVCMVYTCT